MLKALRKLVIYIFNFYSILCLKFDENNLNISKFLAYKNLVVLPFITFLRVSFVKGDEGFSNEIKGFLPSSKFFIIIIAFMIIINGLILNFVQFIQWYNRRDNLNLIIKCIQFHQNFQPSENEFLKAERKFYNFFFSFIFLVFVLYLLEFYTMLEPNWQGFLVFLTYNNNGFSFLLVFAFLNCFLCYFVFLLKNLKNELKKHYQVNYDNGQFGRFLMYMKDLHQLVVEFRKTFGTLLTLLIVFSAITNTIRVR